jgi:hypothetical protein
VHRVAVVTLALVWTHGVLTGSDTAALLAVYLVTGALVVGLAVLRHVARTAGPLPERVAS